MTQVPTYEEAERAARNLLMDLLGPDYSDTVLRVTTDHIRLFAKKTSGSARHEIDDKKEYTQMTTSRSVAIFLKWCLIGSLALACVVIGAVGASNIPVDYWRLMFLPLIGVFAALTVYQRTRGPFETPIVPISWGAALGSWVNYGVSGDGWEFARLSWYAAIGASAVAVITFAIHKVKTERC